MQPSVDWPAPAHKPPRPRYYQSMGKCPVMSAPRAIDEPGAAIVVTDDASLLAQVSRPNVLAVIFEPSQRAAWELELAAAVEGGVFLIERCTVMAERSESLAHLLEQRLPHKGVSFETRLALVDDLAALADELALIAGCRGLMLRLFTEAPTAHCGFHVDTVAPGLPPFGLLKVYNGEGTRYVDPSDISAVPDFYGYLGRRERLERELSQALAAGRAADAEQAQLAVRALDDALPFLRPAARVHEVRAGATVAFRHLDIREHWADHGVHRAWTHCSPMVGATRLVANLTPLDGLAGLQH